MRKAYIVLSILIFWGFLFWYHYVYNIQQLGTTVPSSDATITVPEPANITASTKQILFKPNTYGIIVEGGSTALVDSILSQGEDYQILHITGYISEAEKDNTDFDLAFARASELKKILLEDITEDRIEIFSDTISNFTYTKDNLVEAVKYKWMDSFSEETEEVVDKTENNVDAAESIEDAADQNYFLIDHDNKRIKPELYEGLLNEIAERLVATKEKVTIRGYTDSKGDSELNFTIALRNAKDIRDVFKAKGVKHRQITTTTRGEEAPIADDETYQGRKANRRIEIIIE